MGQYLVLFFLAQILILWTDPYVAEGGMSLSPPFIMSMAMSNTGVLAAGTADSCLWLGFKGDKTSNSGKGPKKKSKKWEGFGRRRSPSHQSRWRAHRCNVSFYSLFYCEEHYESKFILDSFLFWVFPARFLRWLAAIVNLLPLSRVCSCDLFGLDTGRF